MSEREDFAIRVNHLSKMYKLYNKPSDMFWEMVTSRPRYREFWALSDVSFEVARGQVVGLIGRNGAGKSTLLKILAGTLEKTRGEVVVKGRVSSILELGTGFNPENTGRDNVFLGGLMVGMSREEVKRKMDWIIDFSELESVIDQPFKTYSTGMQARLTFSTAVCIDPDILIVDEALAVGDVKFQRKCFGKIDQFRQAGHTILLVSHDVNTIGMFCDHAILLEGGQIVEQGEPKYIGKVYYRMVFCGEEANGQTEIASIAEPSGEALTDSVNARSPATVLTRNETGVEEIEALRETALHAVALQSAPNGSSPDELRMGNRKAVIVDLGILDEQGQRTALLAAGGRYTFFVRGVFLEDVDDVSVGFLVRSAKGVELYGVTTFDQGIVIHPQPKGAVLEVKLRVVMSLTNGVYYLTVGLADPYAETNVQYDLRYDGLQFEVARKEGIFTTSVVDLDGSFHVEQLA